MFIPNYQIHNILKDFTQQLKNGHPRSDAGHQLETVVKKVAGTIMSRVMRLSEEEARRRTRIVGSPAPQRPSAAPERHPTTFYYHTLDKDHRKQKQCLSVENSEQLINRFLSMIEPADDDPHDRE